MGLWNKVKKAAKKAKKAINKVADKVADVVEHGAATVRGAYESIADLAQSIPVVGGALAATTRWLGRVTESVINLGAAAIKAVGSVLAGTVSGVLLILNGDLREGFLDIFHGALGAVLIVVGSYVSLVQTVLGTQAIKRRLTERERQLLQRVFCVSVDLDVVMIVQGASGVFDFNERPFTMGNVIYMKRTATADWDKNLVHETTHVWQYQDSGSSYSSEALASQFYYDFQAESAYDWWDPEVNRNKMIWEQWNRESQAQFIEDVWAYGQLSQDGGVTFVNDEPGIYFDGNGSLRIGRFRFAPVRDAGNGSAYQRWLRTVPPGQMDVDYTTVAEGAKAILHMDCVRLSSAKLSHSSESMSKKSRNSQEILTS